MNGQANFKTLSYISHIYARRKGVLAAAAVSNRDITSNPLGWRQIQKGYMMHDGARVKLEGSKQNLDGEGWAFFVHLPI